VVQQARDRVEAGGLGGEARDVGDGGQQPGGVRDRGVDRERVEVRVLLGRQSAPTAEVRQQEINLRLQRQDGCAADSLAFVACVMATRLRGAVVSEEATSGHHGWGRAWLPRTSIPMLLLSTSVSSKTLARSPAVLALPSTRTYGGGEGDTAVISCCGVIIRFCAYRDSPYKRDWSEQK
jgi:hypothetical protein